MQNSTEITLLRQHIAHKWIEKRIIETMWNFFRKAFLKVTAAIGAPSVPSPSADKSECIFSGVKTGICSPQLS